MTILRVGTHRERVRSYPPPQNRPRGHFQGGGKCSGGLLYFASKKEANDWKISRGAHSKREPKIGQTSSKERATDMGGGEGGVGIRN